METETDEQLVELAVKGDVTAFESIARRYHCRVINLINYFFHGQLDPEDLAQDVFVKVWKNISKFKNKSKFSTWLYRVVINTCLSHKRKKKTEQKWVDCHTEFSEELGSRDCEGYFEMNKNERELIVHNAIQNLPRKQRIAIILFNFEGYKYEEIADIMNVTKSAVQSLLFRARSNLAKALFPLKKNKFFGASIFNAMMSNKVKGR